jgi:hypothetical protein
MNDPNSSVSRLFGIIFFAFVGMIIGGVVGSIPPLSRMDVRGVEKRKVVSLPHHAPKYPGNLTLRFAMVHDVVHERFTHHGKTYYEERNRKRAEALASDKPGPDGKPTAEHFAWIDDLGVGLCLVGQPERAVALMRDKLKQQEKAGLKGRDLYTTYANLGTFLILWQLSEGLADKDRAKARIGESIVWIHKAIAAHPMSHFGREQWQVVLEEFLVAVLDDPKLLLKFDMIGDRLDWKANVVGENAPSAADPNWYRFGIERYGPGRYRWLIGGGAATDPPQIRAFIPRVGAEEDWQQSVKTDFAHSVPFDEPALGIVGMWRLGAGANPFFSLALGEIMLRVGQRHIAWTAYERTALMKDHIAPDPVIQQGLLDHCRGRQKLIEIQLPQEDWPAIRERFNAELAFGQRYQKMYQDYESQKIAAGASIDDPKFYDAFFAEQGPIATPPGPEEYVVIQRHATNLATAPWSTMLLFAGIGAFGIAWLTRPRRPKEIVALVQPV